MDDGGGRDAAGPGQGGTATLRTACLLIAAGGALDALSYVAYGHVFTNAQTGNVVLTAVHAAQGDWAQALRFVPPMLAFLPGIFAAQWLRRRLQQDAPRWADMAIIGLEAAILAALGLARSAVPDMAAVSGLAFTAALQNGGFDHVGRWPFTSVVVTGNLRSLGKAAFAGVYPLRSPEARAQAGALAVVCLCFAAGAGGEAVLAVRHGKAAIALPAALLLLALASVMRPARAPLAQGLPTPGGPHDSK